MSNSETKFEPNCQGKPAVVAFAKNPEQEPVKTRLASSIGAQSAKLVYEALLRDCMSNLRDLPEVSLYIACSPSKQHRYFENLAELYSARLIDQVGCDLGGRMLDCVNSLSAKHSPIIIVGTDSPILPIDEIKCAIQNSKDWDILLGPALDGGYYLIAMSLPIPAVFANINWGSAEVLKETRRNCNRQNLRLIELPECIDVDDMDSLLAMRRILSKGQRAGNFTGKTIASLNID